MKKSRNYKRVAKISCSKVVDDFLYSEHMSDRKCILKRNYAMIYLGSARVKGATSRMAHLEKIKFAVHNPSQSSPSSTVLVPVWFLITSGVFLA